MKVYVVISSGLMDGEPIGCLLGIYHHFEDARKTLLEDIRGVKEAWRRHINFDDPDDWEITEDSDTCYEGYTPVDYYRYTVQIEEKEVL